MIVYEGELLIVQGLNNVTEIWVDDLSLIEDLDDRLENEVEGSGWFRRNQKGRYRITFEKL